MNTPTKTSLVISGIIARVSGYSPITISPRCHQPPSRSDAIHTPTNKIDVPTNPTKLIYRQILMGNVTSHHDSVLYCKDTKHVWGFPSFIYNINRFQCSCWNPNEDGFFLFPKVGKQPCIILHWPILKSGVVHHCRIRFATWMFNTLCDAKLENAGKIPSLVAG